MMKATHGKGSKPCQAPLVSRLQRTQQAKTHQGDDIFDFTPWMTCFVRKGCAILSPLKN